MCAEVTVKSMETEVHRYRVQYARRCRVGVGVGVVVVGFVAAGV